MASLAKTHKLRSLISLCFVSVAALVLLGGGCPGGGDPAPDDGNDNGNVDDGSGNDGSGDDGSGDDGSGDDGSGDDGSGGGDTGGGIEDPDSGGGDDGSGGDAGDDGDEQPDPEPPASITRTRIIQTGDAVPDQPDGVTFDEFSDPIIDADGRVAFWGSFSGSAANGSFGLYVWADGTLTRAIHDDPATEGIVPNRDVPSYFGWDTTSDWDPLAQDIAWGSGGRLLFVSEVDSSQSGGRSKGIYRWRASDANIVRVADLELVAAFYPDAPSGAFVPTFYQPGVSDGGTAIFGVDYLYLTSGVVSGTAIYTTTNGQTLNQIADTVASEDDPGDVPDQGAAAYFAEVDVVSTINEDGKALFQAYYTSGTGSAGIYLIQNGTKYRVIDNRPNASWPGLPSVTRVNSAEDLYMLAIGPDGHIAVDTTVTVSGSSRAAVLMWDFTTLEWTEITGGGSTASALLSGVDDDGRTLIKVGQDVYVASTTASTRVTGTLPTELQGASFSWANAGGAINNFGHAVVPFTESNGDRGLAFWTGSELLTLAYVGGNIPATGLDKISTIEDARLDRPNLTGMLNDTDQMVFRGEFTSGDHVIWVATAQ